MHSCDMFVLLPNISKAGMGKKLFLPQACEHEVHQKK